MAPTPFHAGELLVQQRVNERPMAERNGQIIGSQIPGGVTLFLQKQPMVVVSSLDAAGQVWASVLVGSPGFARSLTAEQVLIDVALLAKSDTDPLWRNLPERPTVGLLFIELSSRRRFRINGQARAVADGWVIDIDQAYANCPKYIQKREVATLGGPNPRAVASAEGTHLTPELKAWIEAADTFFLGSGDDQGALDASHRGGSPGFVRVEAAGTLLVPDYAGNSMYNSLGNFVVNPAAGLLFIDFMGGRTLQLTGRAEILWDVANTDAETGGTNRFWRFAPAAWVVQPLPVAMHFRFLEYSYFNP